MRPAGPPGQLPGPGAGEGRWGPDGVLPLQSGPASAYELGAQRLPLPGTAPCFLSWDGKGPGPALLVSPRRDCNAEPVRQPERAALARWTTLRAEVPASQPGPGRQEAGVHSRRCSGAGEGTRGLHGARKSTDRGSLRGLASGKPARTRVSLLLLERSPSPQSSLSCRLSPARTFWNTLSVSAAFGASLRLVLRAARPQSLSVLRAARPWELGCWLLCVQRRRSYPEGEDPTPLC